MSLSNPNTVVTEQRLKDFYDGILPYLGGSADAGFTPVGTVISVMGVTAPVNYLACNGQVVNIADYPELANYFYQQFGSKNKFGGDGTTTFGIPDLRGEFLRGTGANSHANCGDGAAVGMHQGSTAFPYLYVNEANKQVGMSGNTSGVQYVSNNDKGVMRGTGTSKWVLTPTGASSGGPSADWDSITVRPTNTSVLFCIATKNIYLNPANDYSTDEKVVGTWIDGKPLYQKTFYYNGALNVNDTFTSTELYDLTDLNIDKIIRLDGFTDDYGNSHGWYYFPSCAISSSTNNGFLDVFYDKSTKKAVFRAYRSSGTLLITGVYFTIKYTKTTS